MLDELPGYPARLSPAQDGGFWLAVFAGRTQLIEFVLREPALLQAHDGRDRSALLDRAGAQLGPLVSWSRCKAPG